MIYCKHCGKPIRFVCKQTGGQIAVDDKVEYIAECWSGPLYYTPAGKQIKGYPAKEPSGDTVPAYRPHAMTCSHKEPSRNKGRAAMEARIKAQVERERAAERIREEKRAERRAREDERRRAEEDQQSLFSW